MVTRPVLLAPLNVLLLALTAAMIFSPLGELWMASGYVAPAQPCRSAGHDAGQRETDEVQRHIHNGPKHQDWQREHGDGQAHRHMPWPTDRIKLAE
jgi:hypothetical protein